jgi:hypothetical protein
MRGTLRINRAIDDVLDSLSQCVDLDKLIYRLDYTFDIWMREEARYAAEEDN